MTTTEKVLSDKIDNCKAAIEKHGRLIASGSTGELSDILSQKLNELISAVSTLLPPRGSATANSATANCPKCGTPITVTLT